MQKQLNFFRGSFYNTFGYFKQPSIEAYYKLAPLSPIYLDPAFPTGENNREQLLSRAQNFITTFLLASVILAIVS